LGPPLIHTYPTSEQLNTPNRESLVEEVYTYKVSAGKPEKDPFSRPNRKWENNRETDLRGTGLSSN
jgi:hypothetical protein